MTIKEKQYYNLYLSISRSSQNKPFTQRKYFDGFEEKPEYFYLKKVCNFFNKFPQVKPDLYFKAPFAIYEDQTFFSLDFFASQKAIKAYTLYIKQLQEQSPDSKEQIILIKDSLRYIAMFCIKHNIPISQYLYYQEGVTYVWMQHLRNHNICIYALFEFPNLSKIINSTPEDEKDLFLGDIATNLFSYKTRYKNSKIAKNLVKKGTIKITTIVDKYQNQKKK